MMLHEMDSTTLSLVLAVVLVIVTALVLSGKFSKSPVALNKSQYCQLTLLSRTEITHNVVRLKFALPSPKHVLGLVPGKHFTLALNDADGKSVARTYTPVSGNDQLGEVEIVIKAYFKDPPRFPEGGKMSQLLWNMAVGDAIRALGPKGHLEYLGRGSFHIQHQRSGEFAKYEETKTVKRVGMIAGGTGLTPMLQLVSEALKDPSDTTQFSLLFANQSEEDILLKSQLDTMMDNDSRFKVWYTVDKAPADWKYSQGFIGPEMIKQHLPAPDSDTLVLVCGPPPMINFACLPAFDKLGYNEDTVLFEGTPKSTKAIFTEYRAARAQ